MPSTTETLREMTLRATRGNPDAADFITLICRVLHFWDDLADKDHALSRAQVDRALFDTLVLLPRNRFYRTHFDDLNPVLVSAIQNWIAANTMEDGNDPDDLRIAFIIRSTYVDLVSHTALICGGFEFANAITLEARRLWHGETYVGYLANLEKQRADARALEGKSHVL